MTDRRAATIGALTDPGEHTVDRRRDPFERRDYTHRSNFLPEEEEKDGSRSEFWNFAKALVIGIAIIVALGWVLAR